MLNFILNNLGFDLDAILSQFTQVTEKIMEVQDQVLEKVQGFLDISQFFAPLTTIWETVTNLTISVNGTFIGITSQTTNIISTAKPITGAILYVPGVLIGLFLVTVIVVYILFGIEAWEAELFEKPPIQFYATCKKNYL